jgi:mannose-1-phosphate guanylyltransferase
VTPRPAHAVILAGGRGTRFWPLSRRRRPKQLLDLTADGPLLAATVARIEPAVPRERQWIITGADLTEGVVDALPAFPRDHIIGEPIGRNTAAAVGLAAAVLQEQDGDVPFAVLPSDHLIAPALTFCSALERALEIAGHTDLLLTFGIAPTRPETGYGYIEAGPELANAAPARTVVAFAEKPDRATAQRYLSGGRHLWNSGMFVWRAGVVLAGLRQHLPQAVEPLVGVARAGAPGTARFEAALKTAYGDLPSISIDYALMERAANVAVLPAAFEWNDVGHWIAMRDLWPRDSAGNAARGRVLALDSGGCIVYGPDRLTALVGIKDLIVVHTPDVTLVCSADRAQDVRRLIEELERSGDDRYL